MKICLGQWLPEVLSLWTSPNAKFSFFDILGLYCSHSEAGDSVGGPGAVSSSGSGSASGAGSASSTRSHFTGMSH